MSDHSISHNGREGPTIGSLQARIRQLEAELAEKDFEMDASIVAADAEAKSRIAKMEAETAKKVRQMQEQLRRTTQEANQAHAALQRELQGKHKRQPQRLFQQQQRQHHMGSSSRFERLSEPLPQTQSSQQSKPLKQPREKQKQQNRQKQDEVKNEVKDSDMLSSSSDLGGKTATEPQQMTGPQFAHHLHFYCDTEDSSLLHHLASNPHLDETDVLQHLLPSSTNLFHALIWSPKSRSQIRRACESNTSMEVEPEGGREQEDTVNTRIHVSTDLSHIVRALKRPLFDGHNATTTKTKTATFHGPTWRLWMNQLCQNLNTEKSWWTILTLFSDCESSEEKEPWVQRILPTLRDRWEACEDCLPTYRRRKHPMPDNPPDKQPPFPLACFQASLAWMVLFWDVVGDSILEDETAVSILLDIIEDICVDETDKYEDDGARIGLLMECLSVISRIARTKPGIVWLRRCIEDRSHGKPCYSGIGTMVLVAMMSQHFMERDDRWRKPRNEAFRILHQVLQYAQQTKISFTSLLDERKHDYFGVCSRIMLEKERDEGIQKLVRVQLDQIRDDKEERQRLLAKMSSKQQ